MAEPKCASRLDSPREQPTRKRKRVPVACGACRGKKSKCDGKRPVCSGCETRGLDCLYATAALPSVATVPASYLEQLERRLGILEHDVRSLRGNSSKISTPSNSNEGTHASQASQTPACIDDGRSDVVSPDTTDGVGTIEFDDRSDALYFGRSSNIAFTRLIQQSIAQALRNIDLNSPASFTHSNGQHVLQKRALGISRPPSPPVHTARDPWFSTLEGTDNEAFIVPAKDDRMKLLRRYFSDTGVLFPYVSEVSFWRMHTVAETHGFRNVRKSWLGLMNMILAMAISTDPDPAFGLDSRSVRSYTYFCRAKALCMDQMMAATSVEIVQVMLLMTQYLQGTRRSMQTWTIHGIAVKAALQLGLHINDIGREMDPIEKETRRRTWQGCVGLDRTLSMTFGRPPSIMKSYIRSDPAGHDLSRPDHGQVFWSGLEQSTAFWNATCSLYEILYDILESLYENNLGSATLSLPELSTNVLKIEQKLLTWLAELPPTLALISKEDLSTGGIGVTKKLKVTLTIRFHNVRLLAHRPLIDCYLEHLNGRSLTQHELAILSSASQQSKLVCLQSAETLILIVKSCKASDDIRRGFFGAWWFILYYIMNASLMIIALLLHGTSNTMGGREIEKRRQLSLLDDVVNCIPLIDSGNNLAQKCAELVETLATYVKGILSTTTNHPSGSTRDHWNTEENEIMNQLLPNDGGAFSADITGILPDLEFDMRMMSDIFDVPGLDSTIP